MGGEAEGKKIVGWRLISIQGKRDGSLVKVPMMGISGDRP
jgi:hypothetical protein